MENKASLQWCIVTGMSAVFLYVSVNHVISFFSFEVGGKELRDCVDTTLIQDPVVVLCNDGTGLQKLFTEQVSEALV